jgi:internalin A
MAEDGYIVEDAPEGRTLVVTGAWSGEAEKLLARGEADGLVLNYARGFCEGNLGFLDGGWGVRRLNILDRGIMDLEPIRRLGGSLQALSVQAAPGAQLDLGALPHLGSVAGEWELIRGTLSRVDGLQSVITWRFDEVDLHAFRDHFGLERLTIKEAPQLRSLSGVGDLPELKVLGVFLARVLHDISDVGGVAASLQELEFESCPGLHALDDVESLVSLRFLGFSDCGDVDSLAPVRPLEQLEVLYAWGSTHILDGDLSPLVGLPRLREVRMRNRHGYSPRVADVVSALSQRSESDPRRG